MNNKVYAYVKAECCAPGSAVEPGAEINGRPVSRHGDYWQWTRGKRGTLAIIADPKIAGYEYRSALAVADLKGWS